MTGQESRWGVQLKDPAVLKALAHPARLQMLDVMQTRGGATATECAAVVGLSPSACSWHLRSLAQAGLVEDAGKGGDGRKRLWKSSVPNWQVEVGATETNGLEGRALDVALTQALLNASDTAVEAFTVAATQGDEKPEWRQAALVSNINLLITAQELAEVVERIRDLLEDFIDRDPDQAPNPARVVHAALRFVPQVTNAPLA